MKQVHFFVHQDNIWQTLMSLISSGLSNGCSRSGRTRRGATPCVSSKMIIPSQGLYLIFQIYILYDAEMGASCWPFIVCSPQRNFILHWKSIKNETTKWKYHKIQVTHTHTNAYTCTHRPMTCENVGRSLQKILYSPLNSAPLKYSTHL